MKSYGSGSSVCSNENSIHLLDVKTGNEIQSSDKRYKDVKAQCKTPPFQNSPFSVNTNYTILLLSKIPKFKHQELSIFKENLSLLKFKRNVLEGEIEFNYN